MKESLLRLLRLALLAYPVRSRLRYRDEIVDIIAERVARTRTSRGFAAAVGLAARECIGIVAAGIRRRAAESRPIRFGRRKKEGAHTMDFLIRDLRIAARGLLRRPVFTLVAVLALALGIGSSIAIFTVFHAVLLRPLPFANPDRLVAIWEKNPERGWYQVQAAPANYFDWRSEARSFSGMAGYGDWLEERVLLADGEPSIVYGCLVTGDFFDVLGVAPLEGRVFDESYTWKGPEPAVVLSHGFWSRRFGSDPSMVGRFLDLGGVRHRILGVMPESFAYPCADVEVWLPIAWDPADRQQAWFRRAHGMSVVGRLAGGVSLQEAEAELAAIASRLEADYPETNKRMGTGLTPLQEWIAGDASRPLQILLLAVGLLLLVACANVANMLLARATARLQELRLRSALGGTGPRLVVESLVESLLLAGLGGGLGLALGTSAIRPLLAMSPEGLPRSQEIGVDGAVVLFAIGVTLVSGLLFGSLPAWRAASVSFRESCSRGSSPTGRARRTSSLLVALEVALTLPLVVGAGLMVRTLSHLSRVEPGFSSNDIVVTRVSVPSTRYESDERVSAFYRGLWLALREAPGVETVAMSSRLPFREQRWSSDFTSEGWPADRFGIEVQHDEISPGLFRAMGIPLLRGRDFDVSDDLDSPPVVIINQALADLYFPGEDPIGKRVVFDRTPDESSMWRTIVGVVGNVRRESLGLEEKPSFYAPLLQDTTEQVHLLVAGDADPAALLGAARESLRALDPTLPLFDVTTLEAVVASSVGRERFLLALLAAAAGIALVLSSIGIFGVVFHATSRRVREIGIRVALGARGGSVVTLIVSGGMRPVLAGVVAGLLAALALARAMSSLLFEVQPLDPLTFSTVVGLILGTAFVACLVPARWATRVDASSALRAE